MEKANMILNKITANGDCSHEIKRHLLLGRKTMTNLDSILKSRDITLPTKVHLVKTMVFPVVMYGCESWTIKKAERRRINALKLWCWRRLLKSPLDSKEIKLVNPKGNQLWILIGKTDAKAPILWPPDTKSWSLVKFTSRCFILCDPMNCSTPGFPVLHYLLEFAQIHVHWVSDAI